MVEYKRKNKIMNQQLIDYIKKCRALVIDDQQIRQDLLEAGWSENDINDSFNSLNISINSSSINNAKPEVGIISDIKPQKNFLKIVITILAIVLICGLGVGGYFLFIQKKQAIQTSPQSNNNQVTPSETKTQPKVDVNKIISDCKNTKEETVQGNTTYTAEAQELCYFVEAIKNNEKTICDAIGSNFNKCYCKFIIDYLAQKNEAEKKSITGDFNRSYGEISSQILANVEIKKILEKNCPLEASEAIKICKEEFSEANQLNCLIYMALRTENKLVCDAIENECNHCACQVTVDIVSKRSDSEKEAIKGSQKEIFDDAMSTALEKVMNDSEIKNAIYSRCPSCPKVSPEKEAEIDAINKDREIEYNMRSIRMMAEMYYDKNMKYSGLLCNASDEIRASCNSIKKIVGVEPTFFANDDNYCVFVKLASAGSFCCIASDGTSDKTNSNPANTGYCDGKTFKCPSKSQ